jgi:aspartyl/glutamyl-tRNA(Asn/Gln) amidotransferase C subunit
VRHVAGLSRLGLSAEEEILFGSQLARILAFVDLIGTGSDADTGDDLSRHTGVGRLRLREDEVQPSLERSLALANAASVEAGYVRVPAVLD